MKQDSNKTPHQPQLRTCCVVALRTYHPPLKFLPSATMYIDSGSSPVAIPDVLSFR